MPPRVITPERKPGKRSIAASRLSLATARTYGSVAEAKARGYDVKVLRKIVSLRKQDRNERAEMEMVMDLYLAALGEI